MAGSPKLFETSSAWRKITISHSFLVARALRGRCPCCRPQIIKTIMKMMHLLARLSRFVRDQSHWALGTRKIATVAVTHKSHHCFSLYVSARRILRSQVKLETRRRGIRQNPSLRFRSECMSTPFSSPQSLPIDSSKSFATSRIVRFYGPCVRREN